MPRIVTLTTEQLRPIAARSYNSLRLLISGCDHFAGFGIGWVPPGESARKEDGGPLVPGPWPYVYGKAAVIDNYGGTGAEIKRERAASQTIELALGDRLAFPDGSQYEVRLYKRGNWIDRQNIELIPVKK